MRKLRSQSAMEYLMTYGWAILIIAVVLAVLFQLGVFSSGNFQPHAQAGACQVSRTIAGVSLEGQCNGMLPEFVASMPLASAQTIAVRASPSMNTSWDGGSWSIAEWLYPTNQINTGTYQVQDITEEDTGCTSGLWINAGSAPTGYYNTEGLQWWQPNPPSGGACGPGSGAAGDTNTNKNLPFNQWSFLAVSFDYVPGGTSTMTVCADSNCQPNTVPIQSGNAPTNYASYGYTFYLWDAAYPAHLEGGYLSNVQLYNTSLSTSELNALYQEGIGGAPIRPQNLTGWWPLNGNANDYSGNGNNGQLNGATFSSSWESGYTAP